ncbi:ComF family protein [Flavihumibacter petaseus]|uniref:Phosphoribosyltransferase domain-containing protein n=1 Tax=Flavihumibacter petaseus NBRC 106054 TaxID=1220578 RepID=A0A0E9MXJ2_9BACT|nr:phosphoribosyltransferase family protein [Flavihumibacter petaseus]GAO41845.1 hypothetical protein FPE01S_01_08600 [Flavihumibacter petaseus NBRC 106054]
MLPAKWLKQIASGGSGFINLLFPHCCASCGSSLTESSAGICSSCLFSLPETGFSDPHNNPVARIFTGRIRVEAATALVNFQKKSTVQELLHQIKYGGRADAAIQLGTWMGYQLSSQNWFSTVDLLIPLPLHPSRHRKRGYNQSALLCQGIASVSRKPVLADCLIRLIATSTQTHQHRGERYQNIKEAFRIAAPEKLEGRHVLLVDDVVTTGATLEAAGNQLLNCRELQLSICCLAYTLPH